VEPRSPDPTLPYIGELMKYGEINLANLREVECVALAHDGRQMVSMLLRRERNCDSSAHST